ncbi:MAG TPA: radical SAM protein [Candidatus Nanoarchaeia archaeon]|nr:radical SAM protein [Candidatus Nanoarchaeia archaeon]
MDFLNLIRENNKKHTVSKEELGPLLEKAEKTYKKHFPLTAYFERSIFINWICSIADCKYCFLSTKPRHDPKEKPTAIRSPASILAEVLVCKAMGWRVGYITGGLRVESTKYLSDLISKINQITGEKIMMNFGPYAKSEIVQLKPFIAGMGSAIESFDEELHNFICPSKPLKSLMKFLENLKEEGLQKLITIILGIGERKEDVEVVIEKIKEYNIEKVQLCFLKPQENTVFDTVPAPNPDYMAWWIAKIRIACPSTEIKVALVRERMEEIELYLKAGANGFSRFMVFLDFNSQYAQELEEGCRRAGRKLEGRFTELSELDVEKLVEGLPFDQELRRKILPKAKQYYNRLEKRK